MPDPKPRQNAPYIQEMEPGDYAWCGCGLSKSDPLCDNAHKGTEFQGTDRAAVPFSVDEEKQVVLCGCKRTKNAPYCDGTHNLP